MFDVMPRAFELLTTGELELAVAVYFSNSHRLLSAMLGEWSAHRELSFEEQRDFSFNRLSPCSRGFESNRYRYFVTMHFANPMLDSRPYCEENA